MVRSLGLLVAVTTATACKQDPATAVKPVIAAIDAAAPVAPVGGTGIAISKHDAGKGSAAPTNQPIQDDAAFEQALSGTMLRRHEEGGSGYYRYAYNFLPDHQLLYCSYYFHAAQGQTVESNQVGTFAKGEFSRAARGAVTNCSAIE